MRVIFVGRWKEKTFLKLGVRMKQMFNYLKAWLQEISAGKIRLSRKYLGKKKKKKNKGEKKLYHCQK